VKASISATTVPSSLVTLIEDQRDENFKSN